ncbi:hypothetical protein NQ314_006372 [Rhamnusium bicolor]|uniref:Endoplasmic reticulum junction formation protein lunapark n=1 Tax=Rhamnusium bicolor TaxID=1586634 RepID=A0AAV8Z3N9_9CUCU|nr:hypothetical protein NQ314_006372 [Rhamnusium bicolor]
MGIIIGKFRKKKSTYDILEKLEQEITSIEEFGRSTEQTRKKIVGRFVLLAILVYVILAFALYIYYHKISANQRLICIIPLIAFPLIIWFVKRILTWYYSRKIIKNEKKLVSLKDEKNKILDNVMETETYKVAKKILDKFGNDKKTSMVTLTESTPITNKSSALIPSIPSTRPSQAGLRQRNIILPNSIRGRISIGANQTPFRERPLSQVQSAMSPSISNRSVSGTTVIPSTGLIPGTPLSLPRSILPRDRTVLDKMVDYLVGDGPSNRYALICKKCNCHNGMALKEEFEYLSFRCCYCSAFNPARKMRPTGPKFEPNVSPRKALPAATSDSDKNSASDSDTESAEPILSESRSESPNIGATSDFEKSSDLDLKSLDSEIPLNVVEPDNKEILLDSPMEVCEPIATEEIREEACSQEENDEKEIESEKETQRIIKTD